MENLKHMEEWLGKLTEQQERFKSDNVKLGAVITQLSADCNAMRDDLVCLNATATKLGEQVDTIDNCLSGEPSLWDSQCHSHGISNEY